MAASGPRIQRLPRKVSAQIKASNVVTSVEDVAIGLLQNSLDAGATRIRIQVDPAQGACSADDDGHGMAAFEFTAGGRLGEPFFTSKYPASNEVHGQSGLFLASVAAVSLLTIRSQCRDSISSGFLRLHQSRLLARVRGDAAELDPVRYGHGTSVDVRDLFGNLPVRVKQRSIFEMADCKAHLRYMELLKQKILALVLAWHRPVAVALFFRSDNCRHLIMNLKPFEDISRKVHSTDLDVNWMNQLLCQAGHLSSSEETPWVQTQAESTHVKVDAAISTLPAPSKRIQFVSLGIHPVHRKGMGGSIYDEINALFAASSFGRGNIDNFETGKRGLAALQDRPDYAKAVDHWPKFCIRITWNGSIDQRQSVNEHVLQRILDVTKAMVSKFLQHHHFRSVPKIKQDRAKNSVSIEALPILSAQEAFGHLSRVRSSKPLNRDVCCTPGDITSAFASETQGCGDGGSGQGTLETEFVEWRDPTTGIVHMIDRRTGLVRQHNSGELHSVAKGSRPLAAGSWADGIIKSWTNPVFALTEPAIPGLGQPVQLTAGTTPASIVLARLSRQDLRSAHIFGQVDTQFILAILSTPSSDSVLVLIDQHAADERVRLERLLHEYTDQPPVPLLKSIVFAVTPDDLRVIEKYSAHLAAWGFTVRCRTDTDATSCYVHVDTLPAVIAERCRSEPRVLIDLIRRETWSLLDDDDDNDNDESNTQPRRVGTAMRPPRSILELLNSRACRSAIMFNDPLSRRECIALVERLSGTRMPFQCAHGRPSMIPLCTLSDAASVVRRAETGTGKDDAAGGRSADAEGQAMVRLHYADDGFRAAWKKWNQKQGGA